VLLASNIFGASISEGAEERVVCQAEDEDDGGDNDENNDADENRQVPGRAPTAFHGHQTEGISISNMSICIAAVGEGVVWSVATARTMLVRITPVGLQKLAVIRWPHWRVRF